MANLVDVAVPIGQSEGTESVVSTWFKGVGERVTENEPLLEISTDKVNMEVAAPGTGVLTEILKHDGEQVEPGDVLGRIEVGAVVGGETAPTISQPEPAAQADGTDKSVVSSGSGELSPAVRRLLNEHSLDASEINGTGRGGRITHQDVMDFVGRRAGISDRQGTTAGSSQTAKPAGTKQSGIPGRMVPHNQMRRSIAQHMVNSVAAAPHVTTVFEADLTAIVGDRAAKKADFESRGAKLTFTAYFVKAAVEALKTVPEANSRWHEDALEILDDINIGIATALESGGLIVPVILKARDLDLFGIAEKLQDLTDRARNEKLDARDVQNGTFTISNHGVSGSLVATPIIINQPQSAILGIGKLERRVVPAAESGSDVTIKPMCYVSLTIDHRVLDGYQANQFLTRFVEVLAGF